MRLKLPPYVHAFADRHGKFRFYFRKAGQRVPLPGLPWSPEFMAAHSAAMKGQPKPRQIGASRSIPGTVAALVADYLQSETYKALAPVTQSTYRNRVQRFRNEHGEKRVEYLKREHIEAMLAKKSAKPSAANNFLRMLRMLMQFAIAQRIRETDPTIGIKALRTRTDGYHSWTEGETHPFRKSILWALARV
jgi:hypothetical protein